MPRKRRRAESLQAVSRNSAGIDIGKDVHNVAVDPDRCPEPVRSFDAFTRDLEEMAAWLSSCGVDKVAMESTSVISDITAVTGQRILRTIIAGERDPQRLAGLRDRRIKASVDTIAASLDGTWREEHLFALEQAMQRYDFLERQISACEARIAEQIEHLTPPEDATDDDTPDGTSHAAPPGSASNGAPRSGGKRLNGKDKEMALALHRMMGG